MTAPGRPDLLRFPEPVRVDELRVSILEVPLGAPVPMAIGSLGARHACLVEVVVDGVRGLGETWVNHPGWAAQERLLTFRHGVAPLLAGRRFSSPRGLLVELADGLLPRAEQAGAAGPVWHALSGLDLALWDLLGKRHGQPVAALLARGDVAASVPVYASGIGPTEVERLCESAAALRVDAVKARVGFGAETDARTLRTIRRALGDDVACYADANRAWAPEEAVEMVSLLRDFGVAWLEEPLRHDPPAALARLGERTGMPLAAGENLYGEQVFADHLAGSGLALLQPDPAKSGGLSLVEAVTRSAAEVGTAVSPHCYSGGVALAASVHLAAAFSAVTAVELDIRPNPLRTGLVDESWTVTAGRLAVPTGPGLGVTIDPRTRRRHEVASELLIAGGVVR